MIRHGVRLGITMGFLLTLYSPAYAWTDKTPALRQAPDGYVQCVVRARSTAPIGIVANIMNSDGRNVTEFGSGWRVTTEDGFEAEETAGSFDDASARYHCKFNITGARKRGVTASLTSYDRDGVPVATVEMR